MENLVKKIEELREKILKTMGLLNIDKKKTELSRQKKIISKPGFWDDREKAVEISKQVEELESEIKSWEDLNKEITELEELAAISQKEGDESFEEEANKKYDELIKRFNKLEFSILFSGKYDRSNAFISIHSGAGGVDAQDWARILERMYLRFAEKRGWKSEIMDRTVGSEAGIKSVTMKIKGSWCYGNLRSENGVHRLVRISPFDAEAMRHTSFALVEVIPELKEIKEIEISPQDLRIDVFRSSGPGGQGVNTTDSAVRIVHIPTNITVTCQNERSQHQNKENALKILQSKLFQKAEEEKEKEELKMRGEAQKAEWGKQIRSYVMQPYKMVKDHRTNFETQDVESVLDGNIDGFIEAYLRKLAV